MTKPNLIHATLAAFDLPAGLEPLTRAMIHAGPERTARMDHAKVARHYGLTEQQVREHRDLQFEGAIDLRDDEKFSGGLFANNGSI